MNRLYWVIMGGVAVIAILLVIFVFMRPGLAQNGVPCRYVPNGANITIACANGYWVTTTPEGEVYSGNGVGDPNETAQGSGIVINPGTGGPAVGAGPTVTPPTQQLPLLAPYQAEQYGFQPRQN